MCTEYRIDFLILNISAHHKLIIGDYVININKTALKIAAAAENSNITSHNKFLFKLND